MRSGMARKSTPLLQAEKIEESGISVFWRYYHQNLCLTHRRTNQRTNETRQRAMRVAIESYFSIILASDKEKTNE